MGCDLKGLRWEGRRGEGWPVLEIIHFSILELMVFEEISHNISMEFCYGQLEESITVTEESTKGNSATKMFDEKPKPVLIDEIEVKGVGKDSDEENNINIEDKSSLIGSSEIEDADSDNAGLVFDEWPAPEFVKGNDIDVFKAFSGDKGMGLLGSYFEEDEGMGGGKWKG